MEFPVPSHRKHRMHRVTKRRAGSHGAFIVRARKARPTACRSILDKPTTTNARSSWSVRSGSTPGSRGAPSHRRVASFGPGPSAPDAMLSAHTPRHFAATNAGTYTGDTKGQLVKPRATPRAFNASIRRGRRSPVPVRRSARPDRTASPAPRSSRLSPPPSLPLAHRTRTRGSRLQAAQRAPIVCCRPRFQTLAPPSPVLERAAGRPASPRARLDEPDLSARELRPEVDAARGIHGGKGFSETTEANGTSAEEDAACAPRPPGCSASFSRAPSRRSSRARAR